MPQIHYLSEANVTDSRQLKCSILGFCESPEGYIARIYMPNQEVCWNAPLKVLAFDDRFIRSLSPADAFQVGFWLAIEVS